MPQRNSAEEPLLHNSQDADPEDLQTAKVPSETTAVEDLEQSPWSKVSSVLSLRPVFNWFGRCIGKCPLLFLLAAVLISSCSYGMMKIELKDNVREGFTAYGSRSRQEAQVAREFYEVLADPTTTTLLLLAKDGGTMHRKELLDEAEHIVNEIQNITMKYGQRRLIYRQLCTKPYCIADRLFMNFKKYYDICYKAAKEEGKFSSSLYNLSYPFGEIWNIRIPLEQCLFGVELVDKNATEDTEEESNLFSLFGSSKKVNLSKPIESQITNMEYVKLIAVFLLGNQDTPEAVVDFPLWEIAAYKYSNRYNLGFYNNDSQVQLLVFGTAVLDMEINNANRKLAPYFGGGFAAIIVFVAFCVFSSAIYFHAIDRAKILVGIGAVLCPLLAITSTYGIICLVGSRVNSMLFVMPFLVMGVGVDASFLMVYSWQRQIRYDYEVSQRMGVVYEECIPSISITSLTNVLSFAIGALTPTPEVRIFCLGTALAMGLTFIFQLILFGPLLAIATAGEKPHSSDDDFNSGWRAKMKACLDACVRCHCYLMTNKLVSVLIFGLVAIYWYFAISGLITMKSRLDAKKILPSDSQLHYANSLQENYVWNEMFMPRFFVNTRFDLNNTTLTNQFWFMLQELESLPRCKGPDSSYVWFRGYVQSYNKTKEKYPIDAIYDPNRIDHFLRTDYYNFKAVIKFGNDSGDVYVRSFMFRVVYSSVHNWDIRIELLTKWREIIDRYPELNVTVYEPGAMFADQMLSMRTVTFRTALFTLLCMAIVCAIFMPNPVSIIAATIAIASISTGVIGIMSQLGFDLDPILMASLLMTIGMSVDYIAHVGYHFQVDSTTVVVAGEAVCVPIKGPIQRLKHSIGTVGWPMIQAGLSTICCVILLTFVNTYPSRVFVTAIVLVVMFGTIHGLIVLPAVLVRLPEALWRFRCCKSRTTSPEDDGGKKAD